MKTLCRDSDISVLSNVNSQQEQSCSNGEAASPSPIGWDLSRSGSGERNGREATGPRGPSERERASHRAGVRVGVTGIHAQLLYALCLAIFSFSTPAAFSQRAFNLAITGTNNGVVLSWPVQSATPTGDLFLLPQFQVERSTDLQSWTAISGNLSGSLHQTLSFADTNANLGFYRVQSIIDEEYAQLTGATLDSGQLTGADFLGAELFGASVQNASLNGAEFGGADLRNANLDGSDLTGADLFAAFGLNATFDSGSLAGANCQFANFENGSMFNVDLTGADFSSATLDGIDFDFATFKGVKLDTNTTIDAKPKLVWQIVNQGATNALLTNLDLSFADFTGASFNGANLGGSDFSGSILENTDLRNANFTTAQMRFVDFRGSLLDSTTRINLQSRLVWQIVNQNAGAGADLHGTNLSNTFIVGADLIGANLTNAICTFIICETANFGNANLTRANCSSGDFFGAILTNANMTLGNFSSVDFTDADLQGATTNGANFTGATFSNTIMPDGSIQ